MICVPITVPWFSVTLIVDCTCGPTFAPAGAAKPGARVADASSTLIMFLVGKLIRRQTRRYASPRGDARHPTRIMLYTKHANQHMPLYPLMKFDNQAR